MKVLERLRVLHNHSKDEEAITIPRGLLIQTINHYSTLLREHYANQVPDEIKEK